MAGTKMSENAGGDRSCRARPRRYYFDLLTDKEIDLLTSGGATRVISGARA